MKRRTIGLLVAGAVLSVLTSVVWSFGQVTDKVGNISKVSTPEWMVLTLISSFIIFAIVGTCIGLLSFWDKANRKMERCGIVGSIIDRKSRKILASHFSPLPEPPQSSFVEKMGPLQRAIIVWIIAVIPLYIVAIILFPVDNNNTLVLPEWYTVVFALVPVLCGAATAMLYINKSKSRSRRHGIAPLNDPNLISKAIGLTAGCEMTSISHLQKHLHIRYAQASKIMDEMEQRGILLEVSCNLRALCGHHAFVPFWPSKRIVVPTLSVVNLPTTPDFWDAFSAFPLAVLIYKASSPCYRVDHHFTVILIPGIWPQGLNFGVAFDVLQLCGKCATTTALTLLVSALHPAPGDKWITSFTPSFWAFSCRPRRSPPKIEHEKTTRP